MLRDDAIALINQKLQHTDTTPVILALQQAQIALETGDLDPWFLETSDDTMVTVAGTRTIALPADFMREIEGDPVLYVDSDGNENELKKEAPWSGLPVYTTPGPPKIYYIRGDNLVVLPTPDAGYSLTLPYIAKDSILGANIENRWLKDGTFWIIGAAGVMRAHDLRDEPSKAFFNEMAMAGRGSVERATSARKHINHQYLFGGED